MNKIWAKFDRIKEPGRMFFFLFIIAMPMHIGNVLI